MARTEGGVRRWAIASDDDAVVRRPITPAGARGDRSAELFAPALRRDTLAPGRRIRQLPARNLVGFLWIPAMLTDPAIGFSQPDASYALSLFNFGGVGGAIAGALLIQRVGSRPALLTCGAGGGVRPAMSAMPLTSVAGSA